MTRRQLIATLGASAGALAGGGFYAARVLLPPAPSRVLRPVEDLAVDLYDSLEGSSREGACVEYDHPMRQYHNRGVRGGGIDIGAFGFTREQRRILTDLLHAGLSEEGRGRIPNEYFTRWTGVHWMRLLVCGDPRTPEWQILLTGPHLNLRLGGRSREGVAFGGPMVYGDQRGNYKQGLPENLYRFQFEIADRLFRSLEPAQKSAAVLADSPIQTRIEVQGKGGTFPGVAVADLSRESRGIVSEVIDGVLSTWRPEDVAYARRCLTENGGVEALHLSYYAEGEVASSGRYQIFRLEGPAAAIYFRGFPHVHAFVNIAMDGEYPLSVGAPLGDNPVPLEDAGVKRLFEEAMKHQTGADFGYYGDGSIVGRLRAGPIRTGDIYTMESWQDSVTIVEIKGSRIEGRFLDQLRAGGISPAADRLYRVATAGYIDDRPAADTLGRASSRRDGKMMLRDAACAYLKERGFTGLA